MNNKNQQLTAEEIDIIGEIMNISMGSAATAISQMLDKQVLITTPKVSTTNLDSLDYSNLEPAMLVKITYIEGLRGTNVMVFRQSDMQLILNQLMGKTDDPDPNFIFDEFAISAACEVMNQMMGSSATALSSFLGKSVNISTPSADILDSTRTFQSSMDLETDANIVSIVFNLDINGIMSSEFISIMTYELAKELVSQFIQTNEPERAIEPIVAKPTPTQYIQEPVRESVRETYRPEINVKNIALPQFSTNEIGSGGPISRGNLDLIMNVPLNVSVEIGKTKRKIKEIMELTKGSVIELEKQAGAPVDIVINGQLIARGDIVVIDENFAVRITEIINTKELFPVAD